MFGLVVELQGDLGHKKKAQVSIEYLIIVGFTILLLLPLLYLFYSQSGSFEIEVAATQTDKIAQKIIDAADSVYYLGEPSQQTITVNFPRGIKNITLSQKSISFLVSGNAGDYEVVKWSAANLTGNITNSQGTHYITMRASGGIVVISD